MGTARSAQSSESQGLCTRTAGLTRVANSSKMGDTGWQRTCSSHRQLQLSVSPKRYVGPPRPEPKEFLFPLSVHRKVPGLPLVTLGESPVAREGTEADLSHMKLMAPPGGQALLIQTVGKGHNEHPKVKGEPK